MTQKKKSLAGARLGMEKIKANSQIPQAKEIVNKILSSKRIILYSSSKFKAGNSIVESIFITIERPR